MRSILNASERIFSTFDGVCHQTFRAARFDVLRTVESDSDDEEEYVIKRNKFGAPIYGLRPAPYLNCTNPEDRSSAIQTVTNPFQKISVWKKSVSFLGSLPVPLTKKKQQECGDLLEKDHKGTRLTYPQCLLGHMFKQGIGLTYSLEAARKNVKFADSCLRKNPDERPAMRGYRGRFVGGRGPGIIKNDNTRGGYRGRFVDGRRPGITRDDNMRARGNYGVSAQVLMETMKAAKAKIEADICRLSNQSENMAWLLTKQWPSGQAIVAAVTSGNKRFFLGTNHDRLKKECACECVGVFNALYALLVYAKANIISGGNVGEPVIYIALQLKIMDKLPFDNKLPFKLGMTINKSQVQTLPKVGLILQRPVFSHGQLYVNQEGFEGTHDGEAESSRSKRPRQHETMEELLLPQVHHEFLLWEHIYLPCIVNWDVLNQMGCDGEIDDMLRIRFDEVCADDELQSKKIIKFRLGGRAHSLTLLEFARRFGLYQAVELEEDGFNVYFEGGLRNDDNFNAQDYWLSISREENLSLSRSHTS
ncbi:ribonuclease H-like domain-containing protein [Tanacetum coccineum]